FGLSHLLGDAEQHVVAVGDYYKLHLPRVRFIVSGHPDKPLRVVHGLIHSAYAISAQKPSPRLWCLTSVKQGRSILLCCPMPRIASSSLWDATSTTMPFTFGRIIGRSTANPAVGRSWARRRTGYMDPLTVKGPPALLPPDDIS